MSVDRHTGMWLQDQDVEFQQHPKFKGVSIGWLMNGGDGGPAMSCAVVKMSSEAAVKAHTHPFEDDVVYCLQGTAKMWMDDVGNIDVSKGTFIRVPAGVAHCLHSFSDDFEAFDMFLVDAKKRRQFEHAVDQLPIVEFVSDGGKSSDKTV